MTRRHRRVHGVLWILLAPAAVALAVLLARGGGPTPALAPPPADAEATP